MTDGEKNVQAIHLHKRYISVKDARGQSFGGNQGWFQKKLVRDLGCGLVAAADILRYLKMENPEELVLKETYITQVEKLSYRCLRVKPFLGITGWGLVRGMNKYFRTNQMGIKAHWGAGGNKLESEIIRMLEQDFPVLLSIGPNWPFFWRRVGVTLLEKEKGKTGHYVKRQTICDHYVVVTGYDGQMLELSSWGKRYYIDFTEYNNYVKQFSNSLFSNVLVLQREIILR